MASLSPELKAAYLDAWKVIDAYATRDADGPAKEALLQDVVATHGGPEMTGAVGFIAGSILLQMVAQLQGVGLDELRSDIGQRLPGLLDQMDV